MAKVTSLTDQDRENLVAYLDGELDEATARALEEKLTRDPRARQELDALKRSWDLLDYLPRADASAQFAVRTLDRISALGPVRAARSAETAAPLSLDLARRWLLAGSWVAAILLAWTLGHGGTRAFYKRRQPPEPASVDASLVKELRLFENKGLYEQADNINFLRSLDVSDLFSDDN